MKPFLLFATTLLTALTLSTAPAVATECGDPVGDGDGTTTTDALHILQSSVGARDCTLGACDLNSDCRVSVRDAFNALIVSVGGEAPVDCDGDCPTEQLCGDSEAPTCNGICDAGYVCSAEEVDDVDPDARVTVCHIPPGNHSKAHTIVVGRSAVSAHLRHGDHEGPCDEDPRPCPLDVEGCDPVDTNPTQNGGKGNKHDNDSDSDSDSDGDSDSDHLACVCLPAATTTTSTLVEPPTTTTTVEEPATTTTTVEEPATTTTTLLAGDPQ